MQLILLGALGLALGSFLGSWTWRLPKGIDVTRGRSMCPKCSRPIKWYDNLPVVSYFLLRGRCRNCGRKISARYPLIEISTGALFVLTGLFIDTITQNIGWSQSLGPLALPFFLIVFFLAVAIFIIDFEHQIIPDELVFWGLLLTFTALLSTGSSFYFNLLSGALAAVFLLAISLVTLGRGMGLGDVKLALFFGSVLGPTLTVFWFFTSFLTGAGVGIILILAGRVRFGEQIAFGPFLVASFVFVVFFGDMLQLWLY